MDENLLEDIYGTLCGLYIPEAMVPGVPDLFVEGNFCMEEYVRMRRAYERVCRRLGRDPEDGDKDLEVILEAMEYIQKRLAKEMFRLGAVLHDRETAVNLCHCEEAAEAADVAISSSERRRNLPTGDCHTSVRTGSQ